MTRGLRFVLQELGIYTWRVSDCEKLVGDFLEMKCNLRHISLDFKELYSHLSGGERNCFNQFSGQNNINSDDYSSVLSN